MTWFRGLKDRLVLADDIHIQRYVKCHIMLLFGTVMFRDKSGATVHWKFLPLFCNFTKIIQFSWGSACLSHLYRALYRATRVDCKEIDGALTLLLTWAWNRLPFLAPIPGNSRLFPITNSSSNPPISIVAWFLPSSPQTRLSSSSQVSRPAAVASHRRSLTINTGSPPLTPGEIDADLYQSGGGSSGLYAASLSSADQGGNDGEDHPTEADLQQVLADFDN
ncbi:hypothetical protein Ahy_B04g073389 [Arachis hypogaea]|uniref:Aminotransferase-like plant mobile domain-containing protein n=1 Tax=Arachis hypogaea TaxID=3818 RepID=A0A444ZQA1_ARAHY|nr:hypothetical protein Ahy_B04g073389 [Arachis hypogaea]